MSSRRPWIIPAALLALGGCKMAPPSSVDDLIPAGWGGRAPEATPPEPVAVPPGTPDAPRPPEVSPGPSAVTPVPVNPPAPAAPAPAGKSAKLDAGRQPIRLPLDLPVRLPDAPRAKPVAASVNLNALPEARRGDPSPQVPLAGPAVLDPGIGRSPSVAVPLLPDAALREPLPVGLAPGSAKVRPNLAGAASLRPLSVPTLDDIAAGRAPMQVTAGGARSQPAGHAPGLEVGSAAPLAAEPFHTIALEPPAPGPIPVTAPGGAIGLRVTAALAASSQVERGGALPIGEMPGASGAPVVSPAGNGTSHSSPSPSLPGLPAPMASSAPASTVTLPSANGPVVGPSSPRGGPGVDVRPARPLSRPAGAVAPSAPGVAMPSAPDRPDASRRPREEARAGETALQRWFRDHFPFFF